MPEYDPTGRDAHTPGAKLDAGKAPIRQGVINYFPRALAAVAEVSEFGSKKYAWHSWEQVPDGITRYGNAMDRHAVKERTEGPLDSETGKLHAAHAAWNALARLELILREREEIEKLVDVTPPAPPTIQEQINHAFDVVASEAELGGIDRQWGRATRELGSTERRRRCLDAEVALGIEGCR
jgi:hypothetical protein